MLHTTRWFKYDRDYLCVNKPVTVPVIFEPSCTFNHFFFMFMVPCITNLYYNKPTRCNCSQSILLFYFILLQDHSTCFGCCQHPSSGKHKTVATASDTGHISWQLPSSNMANLATLEEGSCHDIWPVSEAVATVLCFPDDGCWQHPKHVEWSCSKIK